MKTKLIKALSSSLLIIVLLIGIFPLSAKVGAQDADTAQSLLDGIVAYELNKSGSKNIQQWISGSLIKSAGSFEWYAIALSQYGSYDFSDYESALIKYLSETRVTSASSRQKYALALIACGSTDSYIYNTLNDSIGHQGIMSWIYGLNLLNNGYVSEDYSLAYVKEKLLSLRHSDGGWSIMGSFGDVDVTAMAIQALSPYYNNDSSVKTAVDEALSFLSARQQTGGDYASYGVNNPESTAQVLVALSSLGIDCKTDNRFIKDGNTLFDGISLYRLSEGSFCHKIGGGSNSNATVQVFYSLVSYQRMKSGKSGLYIFDNRNPEGLKIPKNTDSKPDNIQGSSDAETKEETKNTSVSSNESSAVKKASEPTDTSSNETSDKNTNKSDQTVTESANATEVYEKVETDIIEENATQEETADKQTEENSKQKSSGNYKLWVSFAIVIFAGFGCGLLYFLKKRNIKNFIFIALATGLAVLIVLFTNFQTTEDYYNNVGTVKDNAIGTVSLTIRCDTIPDKSAEHIPDTGIILDVTEFEIEEGDTVYDILSEATAANKIQLETSGSNESIYVEGISNIYEFDFGDLSGWTYHINGESSPIGCGEYELTVGDKIEWLYTCNLGNDLS